MHTHHTTSGLHSKKGIAIFASGTGSNAQKLIDHFKDSSIAAVTIISCNKPGAGVLRIAQEEGIPALILEKEKFFKGDGYVPELKTAGVDYIVLAGFLWKVPLKLLGAYPKKIINIHPALLPRYGGKGMYGHFVHEAVIAAHDSESGITIHYVDEHYDHGAVIFQARCVVEASDDITALSKKVQALEHRYYPLIVEEVLKNN